VGLFRTRIKDPVRGTAEVVARSVMPRGSRYANCRMSLVIELPGEPKQAVEHHDMKVPCRKWPEEGQSLPVSVERDRPHRIRIEWDEVPDAAEVARRRAEAIASGQAPSGGAGGDRIAELERLARLRDSGALSESEFQAEKARVLGS
jgi:hypothetical protein